MKKRTAIFICFLVLGAALLFAHSVIFNCYDNGDGTFLCQGSFSNGASAEGVEIRIENPKEKDSKKKIILKTTLDKNGEAIIKYADIKIKDFLIIFDAGEGHVVKLKSNQIKK
ncbi:hypothetical protein H0R90_12335 [Treponema putidum]|uniref:Lipoprotein n=1 Tax=Treponema putidum TaxID=221027 RepID=A0AAE9MS28_9SPIR|nr:hypothetical protein [Treponema putidum]AIN92801.1 hypothetical protein JO40_00565 [Treponema putidum]TWI72481.1 hypothetical protein JM98_02465 [Treponema putidum]UTY33895.1 hypothetical protein E4N74_07700 [Treponema putidum]